MFRIFTGVLKQLPEPKCSMLRLNRKEGRNRLCKTTKSFKDINVRTNSRDASSERNVPIVSHIALIESGPKQFSGVLSCPPSPWGLEGLGGDEDIAKSQNLNLANLSQIFCKQKQLCWEMRWSFEFVSLEVTTVRSKYLAKNIILFFLTFNVVAVFIFSPWQITIFLTPFSCFLYLESVMKLLS